MKIGVFGGSFDPVHLGHVELAKAAIKELKLDKLIVVPSFIQPFKQEANPISAFHRIEMLKLAFKGIEKVEISTFEIDSKGISYSFNTLMHFKEIYQFSQIIFIMGLDSLLKLDTWYKGEEMLRTFDFAASYRPGYDDLELDKMIRIYKVKYGCTVNKLLSTMLDISSSDIRILIKSNNSLNGLLPNEVIDYIGRNRLYV